MTGKVAKSLILEQQWSFDPNQNACIDQTVATAASVQEDEQQELDQKMRSLKPFDISGKSCLISNLVLSQRQNEAAGLESTLYSPQSVTKSGKLHSVPR